MYSNSKDQKSIENLYSKILKEDFGDNSHEASHEAEGLSVSPEYDDSNIPTHKSNIEDNLRHAFKSGAFSTVDSENDEDIENAIKQILGGNIPEVEDEMHGDDENVGEDHLPESYNTGSYLSAAGKKKNIINESSSSTAHYLKK